MIMVKPRKVCIALLFVGIDSENQVVLCDILEGLGLKETRFYELLIRDVDILCGWPNFGNKSCVSLCLLHLLSAAFIVLLVFLSSLPRVSFVPLF
jgi:hypothetical protein